jgi:hypothetical protein
LASASHWYSPVPSAASATNAQPHPATIDRITNNTPTPAAPYASSLRCDSTCVDRSTRVSAFSSDPSSGPVGVIVTCPYRVRTDSDSGAGPCAVFAKPSAMSSSSAALARTASARRFGWSSAVAAARSSSTADSPGLSQVVDAVALPSMTPRSSRSRANSGSSTGLPSLTSSSTVCLATGSTSTAGSPV